MNKELIHFLKHNIDAKTDYASLLEKPKNPNHGDFALPVFVFSKAMKKSPVDIAKDLDLQLSKIMPDFLEKIVAVGPFVNFYLNNSKITKEIIENVNNKTIFKVKAPTKEKILIEYPSPNTNKALHIGHVRNILLGNSLGNILEEVGNKVIRTNLNNDRGIAICKAMLGYELYFKGKTPTSEKMKPDQFVQNCYVKFESESKKDGSLNEKAQEMLVEWEDNDTKVRKLWELILSWVYKGYENTYANLKLPKFDCEYYESQIYDKGKDLVLKAIKNKTNGFVKEKDGAIAYDFNNETYGKKYLLRGDGTSLYMTQDLYLAEIKTKKFKADKYIFIVGKEQEYHFDVLFQLLDKMKITNSNNIHYAYGYVYDKDGKKFSSRAGNTLSADDLLDTIKDKARMNLKSKELTKNLKDKELEKRTEVIAYCALSFSMLNVNPKSEIKFDIDRALSFEGESGPYVLYTYARIQSILRKTGKIDSKFNSSLFNSMENLLVKELNEYNNVLLESADKLKPSSLTNYLIRLSQMFNEYYHSFNILKEKEDIKNARLNLIKSIGIVIEKSLDILNIEVLDEM